MLGVCDMYAICMRGVWIVYEECMEGGNDSSLDSS
jgi:hypothetical protein